MGSRKHGLYPWSSHCRRYDLNDEEDDEEEEATASVMTQTPTNASSQNMCNTMCNFWPKEWSLSLTKFEWWSPTRELLKQYLTKKQNGCLRSGRLQEVVAYKKRSL